MVRIRFSFFLVLMLLANVLKAGEYHVSKNGNDDNDGSANSPFQTIKKASMVARAGDTVTVHKGVYREWVDPRFGGTSDLNRILYRTFKGEKVEIKGSELIKGWKKAKEGIWVVTLDNKIFGEYNPYREIIEADWFRDFGRNHHTGEVYLNGKSFYEINDIEKLSNPSPLVGALDQEGSIYQWYCESNSKTTTIWANFHEYNPNKELVEINVRPTVFFPKKTGINYLTVRGFILTQAATTWAPPTSEQTGLIGPNWSKGWIIENNIITHSKCSGISLGKARSTGQNYSFNYKIKSGHISQLESVFAASKEGWSKENIGSHIVRNNTISNCEQTGICGNMGAIFSEISNNHIYDIYTKRQWGGFEMGGIKLHAPIDVSVKHNRIHNTFKGMWIDWQAQGIRISGNLLYDNSWMDLHLEVSHGPHFVDNNIFLSNLNLWNLAVGSAFVNNLFAGQICKNTESERFTPYHYPHSTKIAGMMTTMVGDDRFIQNIFIKTPPPPYHIFEKANRPKRAEGMMGFGLGIYNNHPDVLPNSDFFIQEMSKTKLPVRVQDNFYLNGAVPHKNELNRASKNTNAKVKLEERPDGLYLMLTTEEDIPELKSELINTRSFGETLVSGVEYDVPNGSSLLFDIDYLMKTRKKDGNAVGPFSQFKTGENLFKVWSLNE